MQIERNMVRIEIYSGEPEPGYSERCKWLRKQQTGCTVLELHNSIDKTFVGYVFYVTEQVFAEFERRFLTPNIEEV